jgi:hypothetical protein
MDNASKKWTRPALVIAAAVILVIVVLVTRTPDVSPAPKVSIFPVQLDEFAGEAYPSALATGILSLNDGYLRLEYQGTTDSDMLIWPPGFSIHVQAGTIHVLNKDGNQVARIGDKIQAGGGQVPLVIVEKYTGQTLPEDCPGPYWLVSEVIINE